MVTTFQNIRNCTFQQWMDSANDLHILLPSIIIPLITGLGGGGEGHKNTETEKVD